MIAALLLVAAACGSTSGDADPPDQEAVTTTSEPAPKDVGEEGGRGDEAGDDDGELPATVQTLDITGIEYAFDIRGTGDDGLRPGWTRVRFDNAGIEAHQVMFARLKDGVDLAELGETAAGDSSGSAAIAYVDMLGGVSYIGPGQSIEAVVDLPEGTIMAMCYVPDADGVAHALSGMSTVLNVGPAAGEGSPPGAPVADESADDRADESADDRADESEAVVGTITMGADGYEIPDPLPAGWYRVVNRDPGGAPGEGLHELSILGLDEELDPAGLDRLLDELATNATPTVPLVALGGLGALSSGLEAYLYLDLEPGPYLAVDFMPDPDDPRPHLLDGYVTSFGA